MSEEAKQPEDSGSVASHCSTAMTYQKWHLLDDLLDKFNHAEGDGDDWFNIGPQTRNAIRSLRDHVEKLQAELKRAGLWHGRKKS